MSSEIRTAEDPIQPLTPPPHRRRRWLRGVAVTLFFLVLFVVAAVAGARLWLHHAMRDALPALDGNIAVAGLTAPVRVERDAHGVPHITAANRDDLVFAQGYVTAQDRLWQMDVLRRHAAGELAEILGSKMIPHDRLQRFLQIRASADRAMAVLPAEERHWLEQYARGVNASIEASEGHLPVEFRVLGYKPAPWQARDSLLLAFAMTQDLSTGFPDKLNREAISAKLPPELQGDLFPSGSWRDHPPAQGAPDMTAPREFIEIPLDESQAMLRSDEHARELAAVNNELASYVSRYRCDGCFAGSNNWVVSGAHTASGRPLLSNDMHLALSIPGIWYEADLEAPDFHVAGVTLPGTPFVIVGHNQHIAWGFTNSGADVQDVYIETIENEKFRAADGSWQPLEHAKEPIHVRGGQDVELDISLTRHGDVLTPVITPLYPQETRQLSLRWIVFDPAAASAPFEKVNSAKDWTEFLAAFAGFGMPSQNVVYADDQGHIGYYLLGKIPLRGDVEHPSGLSPVPTPTGTYEWAGYIPFEKLPEVFDPSQGILATANARITPDGYPYEITLDWGPPYRNERIWQVLASKEKMTQADMLALQNDTMSELDQTIAQRIAYAVDHAKSPTKRMRQAADLIRSWDGAITTDSAAAAIVNATRVALWPMILQPRLGSATALYTWKSRSFAQEELVTKMPARWLPPDKADWNELLAAALERGLNDAHAPSDLAHWKWGSENRLEAKHPLFGINPWIQRFVGLRTGLPRAALPGDGTTVRPGLTKNGASERFTADPGDPEHATMNIVTGESGNPASEWYADQFPLWLEGKTLPLPFSATAGGAHTLTLTPR
jgi:penicillin amidase